MLRFCGRYQRSLSLGTTEAYVLTPKSCVHAVPVFPLHFAGAALFLLGPYMVSTLLGCVIALSTSDISPIRRGHFHFM